MTPLYLRGHSHPVAPADLSTIYASTNKPRLLSFDPVFRESTSFLKQRGFRHIRAVV